MAAAGPARKRARTTGSHQLTISESFARRDRKEAKQEMASLTEVIDLSTPPLLHPSPSPNCTPPESPLLFSNPSSPCSSDIIAVSDRSTTEKVLVDSQRGASLEPDTSENRDTDISGVEEHCDRNLREKRSSSKSPSLNPSSPKPSSLPVSRGVPLSDICFGPSAYPVLPPLQPSSVHTVLFRPRLKPGIPPKPFPDTFRDIWDAHHVRMPCSSQSLYPVTLKDGEKKLLSRWDLIKDALRRPILNSYDLEAAILSYNSHYSSRWNFQGLHTYFNELAEAEESGAFFGSVLPKIIDLALALPTTVTHAVPLLKKQQNFSVTLSQQQIACLLANAFLCTFPRRNTTQSRSEYSSYPSINFSALFASHSRNSAEPVKVEKLKCILSYFTRVTSQMPEGVVTFTRQVCVGPPQWDKCTSTFTQLRVDSEGTIENNGHGMLQVDFANRCLGGGVLGWGCVQEEIRFLICPELIVSRLFCEELDANESVVITGAERYSDYSGYSSSFEWHGRHIDGTLRDRWGRRETQVVAIDALVFHSYEAQFKPGLLRRELNKAYCGYMHNDTTSCGRGMAVATGNWGCGAFGGDARLKALLQLMAASVANRDIVYFTFGDRQLQEDMFDLYTFLRENGLTVCSVWDTLLRYYTEVIQGKGQRRPLYDFIVQHFTQSGRAGQSSQSSQSGRTSQSTQSGRTSQSSGPGQESATVEYSLGV